MNKGFGCKNYLVDDEFYQKTTLSLIGISLSLYFSQILECWDTRMNGGKLRSVGGLFLGVRRIEAVREVKVFFKLTRTFVCTRSNVHVLLTNDLGFRRTFSVLHQMFIILFDTWPA